MTRKTIYFDNAASTFPKPEAVYAAQDNYFRNAANPGRGAHAMSIGSATAVFEARTAAAELLGIKEAQRLVFTPGCTYSINFALQGFPFQAGDIVLVTALEHNSVMRPLRWLERERGIVVKVLQYAGRNIIDLHNLIQTMLEAHPRLCVFTESSNVTGEILDMKTVAAICGAHKVPLMIDAAQTAGRMTEKVDDLGVSIWCASGHKGLFGAPGVGLLYTAPNIDLNPSIFGGTGSNSEKQEMPDAYPDRLEAGTLPGPAIAALGAGVNYLREVGVANVIRREHELTDRFLSWVHQHSEFVRAAGNRAPGSPGTSLVSFLVRGIGADVVAQALDAEFGIAVRAGLHCSSAAHSAIGTLETGLVRASFGYFNTEEEVDQLCAALESIASRASHLAAEQATNTP